MSGGREIYFEIIRMGAYAKCTAIDSVTGREVSVVGPGKGQDEHLKRMAAQKLERTLSRP